MHKHSNKYKHTRRTLWVEYDPSPFTFSVFTTMPKIHFLFAMVGVSHGYVVTNEGTLVGVITKKDLIRRDL